jgi:hypothetical protein
MNEVTMEIARSVESRVRSNQNRSGRYCWRRNSRVQSETIHAGVVAPEVMILHAHTSSVHAVVVAVGELKAFSSSVLEELDCVRTRSHSQREKASASEGGRNTCERIEA